MCELNNVHKLKEKLDNQFQKNPTEFIIENGCLNGLYIKSEISGDTIYIYYGMDRPLMISEEALSEKRCWYKYHRKYNIMEFFFAL